MPPDPNAWYAEFTECRGKGNARMDEMEGRMTKNEKATEGLEEAVRENGNKLSKIFVLGGLAVLILIPLLNVWLGRLVNGSGH